MNPLAFTYMLFMRQLNVSFRPILGGDEIIAGAVVVSGPAPYPLHWLSAAGGTLLTAALATVSTGRLFHPGLGGFWGVEIGATMPPLGMALLTAPYQKSAEAN